MIVRGLVAPAALLAALASLTSACKTPGNDSALREEAPAPSGDAALAQDGATRMQELLKELRETLDEDDRAAIRDRFFKLVIDLNEDDLLEPSLDVVVEAARKLTHHPMLEGMDARARRALVKQIADAIDAELINRGEGRTQPPRAYVPWPEVTVQMEKAVREARDLRALAGADFHAYDEARLLVNGPASFAERDALIPGARKSIWILSWAFYEDLTGDTAADMLIKQHKNGVDVRVVVDGQSADRQYDASVKKMEAAGVPVIRWRSKPWVYNGMHRKVMIVDGQTAICGGMNFGNEYSHKGTSEPRQRWRDTDLLVRGDAAKAAAALFAGVWNAYAREWSEKKLTLVTAPAQGPAVALGAKNALAFIDQDPSKAGEDPVYLATLKAIADAKQTIDISNAYYIATPPVEHALLAALQRGVKVRLHTNSADSVDEPQLIRPIMRGLPVLKRAGAEVYLQRGTTVHSKYLVIDQSFGWVGSYNLHPRSFRYEGETVAAFWSPDLGAQLTQVFEKDVTLAQRVNDASEVALPESPLSDLAESFFFEQL